LNRAKNGGPSTLGGHFARTSIGGLGRLNESSIYDAEENAVCELFQFNPFFKNFGVRKNLCKNKKHSMDFRLLTGGLKGVDCFSFLKTQFESLNLGL
jgi:hypothetical protein